MFRKILSHPLFSGSVVMVGGSMVVNVVNYLYHVLMGRILGPVDYGILASIFSLLYIASIVPLSTSVAIVKFISSAKNPKEVAITFRGIRSLIFKVALVTSIVILLMSGPISSFLHIESLFSVILVAPVLFFTLITLVNQSVLQGLLKFSGVVGPNLVSSVFKLVLGIGFVLIGWSVSGAIGAIVISAILAYLYSYFLIRKSINEDYVGKFDIKPFLKFSLPVLIQALSFTSFFTVDVLLAKHFLSPVDAGLYAALSTLGKIIYFATTPISGVMFPIVSRRHSTGESYRKVLLSSFAATVIISVVIIIGYGLFPDIAIGALFGNKYLSASRDLIWMGLFMAFYAISYLLTNYLLSIGKTRIVILPLAAAIIQGVLIFSKFHNSLSEVINISLYCMIALFLSLSLYVIFKNEK